MSETNPNETNPNPYAPGIVQKKPVLSDVEQLRQKCLGHEASVKSIGILFIIGGLFCLAGGSSLYSAMSVMPSFSNTLIPILASGFIIVIAIGLLVVAFGLRKLSGWSQIPAALFAGIGLFSFPLGTVVNFYVLYLLLSQKGRMVFSPEYKEVIAQTPHMKYKTSAGVLLFIILLIVLALVMAFAFRI